MKYSIADIESFAARFYQGRNLLITPYAYNTIFLALAQNAVQTNTINIAANADFIALGLRHRAQIGAVQTISTITIPFVRVLITDSGSNEQFSNTSIDLNNYAPVMPVDFPLPYPRIVSGRSTLTVQATNYAPAAETYTSIELSIYGVLIRALQG
jgi:hypothetical protein